MRRLIVTPAKIKIRFFLIFFLLPAVTAFAQEEPTLEDWVRKLGDDRFEVREEAMDRLLEAGPQALPLVEKGLQSDDSEVRLRCEKLMVAIPLHVQMHRFSKTHPQVKALADDVFSDRLRLERLFAAGPGDRRDTLEGMVQNVVEFQRQLRRTARQGKGSPGTNGSQEPSDEIKLQITLQKRLSVLAPLLADRAGNDPDEGVRDAAWTGIQSIFRPQLPWEKGRMDFDLSEYDSLLNRLYRSLKREDTPLHIQRRFLLLSILMENGDPEIDEHLKEELNPDLLKRRLEANPADRKMILGGITQMLGKVQLLQAALPACPADESQLEISRLRRFRSLLLEVLADRIENDPFKEVRDAAWSGVFVIPIIHLYMLPHRKVDLDLAESHDLLVRLYRKVKREEGGMWNTNGTRRFHLLSMLIESRFPGIEELLMEELERVKKPEELENLDVVYWAVGRIRLQKAASLLLERLKQGKYSTALFWAVAELKIEDARGPLTALLEKDDPIFTFHQGQVVGGRSAPVRDRALETLIRLSGEAVKDYHPALARLTDAQLEQRRGYARRGLNLFLLQFQDDAQRDEAIRKWKSRHEPDR